ncbi:MAG: hypothetical protein HKN90_00145 [Flavobacteriaceae bacterium]|nr:hypothetical protein [Flavobacteriaceae bacterium]
MKRRLLKVFSILSVLYFVSTGFTSWKHVTVEYNVPSENAIYTVLPTGLIETNEEVLSPITGKTFIGFKEAVGFKESQGRYSTVNTFGYLGKYQFGKSTLKRFKIYDTVEFLKDAELQEDAFEALCSVNKWILIRDIKRSVGKRIKGIRITESGILAAAHLAGAGNVKKFLRSNGTFQFSDAYGTTIEQYLKKFAGYDTSIIEANRKPVF